jgi:hypothetical protein
MILSFLFLGNVVDTYLHDHSFTFPYKIVLGLLGTGAILFIARQLKSVVLRKPVKSEDYL